MKFSFLRLIGENAHCLHGDVSNLVFCGRQRFSADSPNFLVSLRVSDTLWSALFFSGVLRFLGGAGGRFF